MAKLAEQYVAEFLNREGFATIQGVRKGNNEWDVLAIRVSTGHIEAKHVEVQVSYDPVSYLSNQNARKRSEADLQADIKLWMEKKFTGDRIVAIRKLFYPGEWKYELVHGVLADPKELELLRELGVIARPFSEILTSLCKEHPRDLPFVAEGKDAVELVRNLTAAEE